jgi:hypothetical protein
MSEGILIPRGITLKIKSIALYLVMSMVAATTAASCSVVVNEMELNPPQGGSDWVELYNSGNQTVDISGWTVTTTDGSWVGKMPVPKGTIISAKSFYVAEGNPLWHHDNGGFATLYSDSGEKVDESPYRVDNLNNDFTWGRHPDGYDTNTNGDWGFGYATKGRSNVVG